jgi:cytochrome c oxidase subunit 1
MWRGSLTFETPMLFTIGFLVNFVFGGLTGVILSSPPLDFHISDTYFVVAHFHYVLVGAVVFVSFAAIYFWWPKLTGRMLNETLGKWNFWLLFIGFNVTFLIQHWIGVTGMPRRYWSYLESDGVTWMNELATAGSVLMSLAMLPFIWNLWITARRAPKVTVNDPWGYGRSLEWATACPIPRHNFTSIPRIRSESPAFDANHPEVAPPATT